MSIFVTPDDFSPNYLNGTDFKELLREDKHYYDLIEWSLLHAQEPDLDLQANVTSVKMVVREMMLYAYKKGRLLEASFSYDQERQGNSLEGRFEQLQKLDLKKTYGDKLMEDFEKTVAQGTDLVATDKDVK